MTHAVTPTAAALEVALSELAVGDRAVVVRLRDSHESLGDEVHSTLAQRLLELGFIPGEPVEVVGSIWPGADPMAVRLGRSLFALRRREAAAVLVTPGGGARQ
jgi:ferrous iron transport protein A